MLHVNLVLRSTPKIKNLAWSFTPAINIVVTDGPWVAEALDFVRNSCNHLAWAMFTCSIVLGADLYSLLFREQKGVSEERGFASYVQEARAFADSRARSTRVV